MCRQQRPHTNRFPLLTCFVLWSQADPALDLGFLCFLTPRLIHRRRVPPHLLPSECSNFKGRALLWLGRYESKVSFTNQAESFWNKAWAKACFYGSCSESVCRRKDGWRSTEAVHHSECGWIMDTVLHSQPFANPCSNATFPGCAERFNGTNPRGLFLFIHLKPCFELLQTGHCPSQHTKHCTGAHTFHSAWQTSWTQSLIYIWS